MAIEPPCRLLDRFNNFHVSRASALISIEGAKDIFIRGVRIIGKQRIRRKDHTRCAEPALNSAAIDKRLLNRVRRISRTESGNRKDLLSDTRRSEDKARIHELLVKKDRAGAAAPFPTHAMNIGKPMPAKDIE
jgi:hypothetical protein